MTDSKTPDSLEHKAIEFLLPDEEFESAVESQRTWISGIADRLSLGAPLDDPVERQLIVAVLRRQAERMPRKQKRKQGPSPKICPGSEALKYATYRLFFGLGHGDALKEILQGLSNSGVEISDIALAKGIKPYRRAAFALFGREDPGNQTPRKPK